MNDLNVGDLIYCITEYEHDAEYGEFYYLCSENDYILAVPHYFIHSSFKSQVEQMYQECEGCKSAHLCTFKKDMIFNNEEDAELKCREIERRL